MQKNVAGQKVTVFAFGLPDHATLAGQPVTGLADITANISKDFAAVVATNDLNPTEQEDGFYSFDLLQAETNADTIQLFPASATADVQVIMVGGIVHTVAPNFNALGIAADGDLSGNVDGSVASVVAIDTTTGSIDNVTLVDTTTTNTDMRGTDSAYTGTPPTAIAIVDEWESQSQADPTGFHVNVLEVSGTAQTANDNGADINTLVTGVDLNADQSGVTIGTVNNVSGLVAGTGGISVAAESFTLTVGGTPTNDYTATRAEDGTHHIIPQTGGDTDGYYQFNVGNAGVPQSVTWVGYAQSNGDSYTIYGYNYSLTAYEPVGTISASNGSSQMIKTFDLLVDHVGTGVDSGKVRLRFLSTDGTNFATDRLFCTYTQAIGGIPNGSTITLAASATNENFIGNAWKMALGGQAISGSFIGGAVSMSGTGTIANANPAIIQGVKVDTCTLSAFFIASKCDLSDVITLTSTSGGVDDEVDLFNCASGFPGVGSPTINASGLTKTTGLQNRLYGGGITYSINSFCTLSHETIIGGTVDLTNAAGSAEIRGAVKALVLTSSGAATTNFVCTSGAPITVNGTGGTLNVYGTHGGITDNSGATVTINDLGANITDIPAILDDTGTSGVVLDATATSAQLVTDTWDALTSSLTTAGSVGKLVTDNINATISSRSTLTEAEVWAYATRVLTAGTNLNDVSTADIDARLAAIGLDHLIQVAVTGTDVTNNSIIAQLVSKSATADWDTYNNTTDSQEAIVDTGNASWTTGAGGTPPDLLQSTTIATLATQTSFTLTDGSPDTGAYDNQIAIITDAVTGNQKAVANISAYVVTGVKTITLLSDPAIFVMAVGDTIEIITATGAAGTGLNAAETRAALGLASANLDTQLSTVQTDLDTLTGTDGVTLATAQPNYLPAKAGDSMDVGSISGDATAANNLESQYDGTGLTGNTFPATQGQVGNIATGSSAISTIATSRTLTTGSEGATSYTDTETKNGVYHEITDAAGTMDVFYEFDVTDEGVGSEVSMWGRLYSSDDNITVYAWDWISSGWDAIGDMSGINQATDGFTSFNLLTRHTGTDADAGLVRVRGYGTGLTTSTLYIDQAYVSFAIVPTSRQTKGVISDISPTTTGFDTDLTNATGIFEDALLIFKDGPNAKESRPIVTQVSTNGALTFDEPFSYSPTNGDNFTVYHTHIHPVTEIREGLATEVNVDATETKVDALIVTAAAIDAKTTNLPADPASETNVDATETKVDSVITTVTAINTKTTNLPADPASETNVDATEAKVDTVITNVAAVDAKTTNLPADPASETNVDATETKVDTAITNIATLQSDVTLIKGGTIEKNTAGSINVLMLDSAGDPVTATAVTGLTKIDTAAFTAMGATISVTDAYGYCNVAYTAADVNGTDTVAFRLSATGANDSHLTLQLT